MGKTIPLGVEWYDTIEEVKRKIKQREGHPPEQQRLIYLGKVLNDKRTMFVYGITADSILHLYIRNPTLDVRKYNLLQTMHQINLKTVMGKTINIFVHPCESIENVKQKIEAIEGIPTARQSLIFSGKELDDEGIMSDYCISQVSTIFLVLNVPW